MVRFKNGYTGDAVGGDPYPSRRKAFRRGRFDREIGDRDEGRTYNGINSNIAGEDLLSIPHREQPLRRSATPVPASNKKNKVYVSFRDPSLTEREIAATMALFGPVKHCYLA